MIDLTYDTITLDGHEGHIEIGPLLFSGSSTFTRSNGSISARIYERLTKASRRRTPTTRLINIPGGTTDREQAYRQGVYDAIQALQDELT